MCVCVGGGVWGGGGGGGETRKHRFMYSDGAFIWCFSCMLSVNRLHLIAFFNLYLILEKKDFSFSDIKMNSFLIRHCVILDAKDQSIYMDLYSCFTK